MKRADVLLVEQGVFESRKKAQVAIEKGLVLHCRDLQKTRIQKSSQDIDWKPSDRWEIGEDLELRYVSRAGAKLHAALEEWQISVEGKVVLDVGLSTGGFSDCLLQKGARSILGVDVGHSQLHPRLKNNPALFSLEKWNAKNPLEKERLRAFYKEASGDEIFDLMVVDVSFISMMIVLEAQWPLLKPQGHALILFKPQFEVGPALLDKKGLVSDAEGLRVLQKTVTTLGKSRKTVLASGPSALRGEDGNQEYFIYLQK